MIRKFMIAMTASAAVSFAAPADAGSTYNIGSTPTAAEIANLDIDIRPDGKGLPTGRGTMAEGEPIYAEKCGSCHGEFGEGAGRFPVLVGGEVEDLAYADRPEKTIGSYWPFASTLYDYIYRAMPYGDAQSLTADETYAITAFLLAMNNVIDEDFVLDQDSFKTIKMPNAPHFVDDPRPDTRNVACMADCGEQVKIVSWASKLNVTPEEEKAVAEGDDAQQAER